MREKGVGVEVELKSRILEMLPERYRIMGLPEPDVTQDLDWNVLQAYRYAVKREFEFRVLRIQPMAIRLCDIESVKGKAV